MGRVSFFAQTWQLVLGALLAFACRIGYDELPPNTLANEGGAGGLDGVATLAGGATDVSDGGEDGAVTTFGGDTVAFGARSDADYPGASDTFISEDKPDQNRASTGVLQLSGEAEKRQVGLLKFDLSALAPGTTIKGAVLGLLSPPDTLVDGVVNVHEMLESWVDVEATWNERMSGTPWTVPGAGVGSRSGLTLTTFSLSKPSAVYEIPLPAALVQLWVDDPSANFGLALVATGTDVGALFASSAGIEANRPLLVVSVL